MMQSQKVLLPCHFERSEKSCTIYYTNIIKIYPDGGKDILWFSELLRDRKK